MRKEFQKELAPFRSQNYIILTAGNATIGVVNKKNASPSNQIDLQEECVT